MHFSLTHIWASMGLLSKLIAGGLVLMALASVAVIVERMIALARAEAASKRFAVAAKPALDEGNFGELPGLAKSHAASALAKVVGTTAAKYEAERKDPGGVHPVEMARRESARMLEAVGAELRRGLSVLATVGSISPFVGLLGTVVGIITTLKEISATNSAGMGSVMGGISEALVETALGLLVAIPVVLVFNYLSGRISAMEAAIGRSSSEFIDELENEYGRRDGSELPEAA
jgi:biopolymer transport protein ExbB